MPLGSLLPILSGGSCHCLLSYKASREKQNKTNQIICVLPEVSRNATYRLAVMLLSLTRVLEGTESGGKVVLQM